MSATPVFVGTPKTWHAALSAANTNRDGTGTKATVVSGGANGSRIDRLRAIATAAVTNGVVRLFISDGANIRLHKEIMVTLTTPSATVETWSQDLTFPDGLIIPNGWSLQAATHNAEAFNVFAHGGDL
jgi:hypothetical protein